MLQLAARSARYRAEAGADAVAEIALRLTLGSAPGQAAAALGMGQPHEVQLDRLRLMCLGARTERDGQDQSTDSRMVGGVVLEDDRHFIFVYENGQLTYEEE